MANKTEQRLAKLEEQVAELKRRLDSAPAKNGNWLDKVIGSMANNPAFDEAMKLAADIRRKQRSP